ncbi:MAG: glycosyl hydrolase [Crocinitomicaceae bacterium]|nr:glycosyl hydrolase [Crocinitomicaceae bacterium]|tara:strand:+ start:14693 stop:17968 length:3276 start_codon:yes stop_codon:yes gene_type:complete
MKRISLLLCSALLITSLAAQKDEKDKSKLNSGTLSALKFRSVGPALTSGRVSDMAVDPTRKSTWYVTAASGGVWKTVNAGTSFKPIFDGKGSYSIGCVTIDPNNHNVIWIGTGENNNQRSVAYGDGLYKSSDGGKSFKKVGLENSEHIGMIKVDPNNSDRIFVAAYGPLWKEGGDRGLYLSEDGGSTWNKVLEVSEHTGFNEVHFDPRNSNVIYATAHQRRRHVWTYISGGPESAIYKSTDGGKTFTKLENGLPKGDVGRISLAISPQKPDVLYAMIEATSETQGIYHSTDRGASWKKVNKYASSGNYYVELVCDPHQFNRIYSMDTWAKVSNDGGTTWKSLGEKSKHVDNHCMWIDPDDAEHYVMGCDGGIYESWDKAATWDFKTNLPITQFYKVTVDNDEPFYNIAGGTQDNFSLMGPSRTSDKRGIVNSDWFVTKGGDGFESAVDPKDPNIVYAQSQYGWLVRYDKASGEKVDIKPQPKKDEAAFRWNWDAPLIISPHNNKRLYFAANKLFRSEDRGNSWKAISGDLTRQIDRNTLPVMGKVWSMDAVAKNKSTTIYGNIVALSESPKQEDLIYVGTDDGLIQITSDAGQNWKKIESVSGVPAKTYVNMLLASRHSENTVYAIFNNHKNGDFKPYVYRSRDKGATWSSIGSNLPERGSVYCIVEDHINANLLFVGTEFGVFVSVDGGGKWTQLKAGLPTIAVRDMEIQTRENDLVLGTFGRGFYVLDNYSPLREITEEGLENDVARIYSIKDGEMYIESSALGRRGKSFQGESYFNTQNPPVGAVFTYYLKEAPKTLKKMRQEKEKELIKNNSTVPYPSFEEIRAEDKEEKPYLIFTISDKSGKVVRKLKSSPKSGLNRITWDLRFEPQSPVSLKSKKPKNIYQGYDYGRMALPGQYTVSMSQVVRGKVEELTQPVGFNLKFLELNKQIGFDRTAIEAFAADAALVRNRLGKANKVTNNFTERTKYMKQAVISTAGVDNKLLEDVDNIQKHLSQISIKLYGDQSLSKREFETSPSINSRLGLVVYYLWRTTSEPTATQIEQVKIAKEDLHFVMDELKTIKTELKDLEKQLQAAGASYTPGWMPELNWD